MKFGKRLGAEAGRGWQGVFLDYKACKRAIGKDVTLEDPYGSAFESVLRDELQKINGFFTEKEEELKAVMRAVQPGMLTAVRAEVLTLRKFSILNATAIIKAVKKRNKHLGKAVGQSLQAINATQLLSQQYFFVSHQVAGLLTQADMMAQGACTTEEVARALEEWECPICLAVLENPVTLSCAHRFCWGCLLSHCATCQDVRSEEQPADGKPSKPGDRLLTAMLSDSASISTYPCPVCRKAHPLDLDRLQVDTRLASFLSDLKRRRLQPNSVANAAHEAPPGSAESKVILEDAHKAPETITLRLSPQNSSAEAIKAEVIARPTPKESEEKYTEQLVEAEETVNSSKPPLLPPQTEAMKGRMTVVLDLDGTLISSFAPRRAPSFSKSCSSYVVGKGAKLNPNGVLVVERPELGQFLAELSKFAEVVVFTAGLEDYASPICRRLQYRFGEFQAVLYRPATVAAKEYPCVKDLSLLGRDLQKTVLVDDTPLAFLHQPDNGVPIYSFRGDEDDRVLLEAILPLLQQLATCEDVRPILHKRFNMPSWLLSHGIQTPPRKVAGKPPRAPKPQGSTSRKRLVEVGANPSLPAASADSISDTLILTDFDKTLTDCDAGESLVGELAPELVPMLASLQQPANFVPLTNAVMSEVARRGVDVNTVQSTLAEMGSSIPDASKQMLQWLSGQQIDVRIISDCNTLFIGEMLKGAGVHSLVKGIITNAAEAQSTAKSQDLNLLGMSSSNQAAVQESQSRVVIKPRHDVDTEGLHRCPMCPSNLCKGLEMLRLRKELPYKRIIYLGDGANDLCPAIKLQPQDVVLARKGFDLDKLIHERQKIEPHCILARVERWSSHSELFSLVKDII